MSSGLQYGWPSPSIPILMSAEHEYRFTIQECSYLTAISPAALLICGFPFAYICDKIGRKRTLLLASIPYALSFIFVAMGRSIYMFYLARVCTGCADAGLLVAFPAYIGEIAEPKVRGIWGNAPIVTIYLGQLLANVVGGYLDIKTTAWIFLAIPVLFALTFVFMPESPYFHIMRNNLEDAEMCLKKLRNSENVYTEMITLKEDVKRQTSECGEWKDLFYNRCNRRALLAAFFLRLSQQLSGMAPFAVYTQYIFLQATGGDISATDSSILVCAVLLIISIWASIFMDKLGRRKSMIISLASCSIILGAVAIYFYISVSGVNVTGFTWIPLAGMLLYTITFSIGLGLVPTLMLGELFSASIKSKGSCVMIVVYGLSVSGLNKLFQVLETDLGLYAPFAFFSVCCFYNIFLIMTFVPETKCKTLEEIQQELNHRSNKALCTIRR